MANDKSRHPGKFPEGNHDASSNGTGMSFWSFDDRYNEGDPSGIIYLVDVTYGKVMFISDAVEMLTGYSPSDFYDGEICWSELVHPEDISEFEQDRECLNKQSASRSLCSEYRIVRSDKAVRNVRDVAQIITRNGQRVLKGAVTDITKMKYQEARLKRLEKRFSVMKEAERIGLWEYRLQDQLIVIDNELCRLCAIPQEKRVIEPEYILKLLGEGQRKMLLDAYKKAVEHNEPFDVRCSLESGTGRQKHLRSYGRMVPEEEGEGRSLVGVVLDITEYVETDQQVETDELRLESLLNMTQQHFEREEQLLEFALQEMSDLTGCEIGYICMLDETQSWIRREVFCCRQSCSSQVHHRLPVSERNVVSLVVSAQDPIIVNQSSGHMLAADLQDHYHVSISNLAGVRIPDDDLQHAQAVVLLGNKYEDFNPGDVRQIRLMSGFVWQMILNRRKEQEAKQYEMRLKQSKRMETIGRLVSGVSHDFKNMLTVILGYADMLEEECENMDKEAAPHILDAFRDLRVAAERALGISNQLLVFSQEHKVIPQVIDLKQEMDNLQSMLQRLVQEDVELEVSLSDNLWKFQMDINQLNQVFLNLIINARDAMPQGGEIKIIAENCYRIESSHLMKLQTEHEQFVCIAVADTGEGIEREHIHQLFEPFFSTKYGQGGTGLGLATVQEIVEQYGGTIEVSSTKYEGTAFSLYLPACEIQEGQETAEGKSREEQYMQEFAGRVMLVEDDTLVLQHIKKQLSIMGFTVTALDNSVEALETFACSQESYDLLVTDVIMPHINGRRLHESLDAMRPGLPTLFITGFADDVIQQKGLEESSREVLHKPFTKQELVKAVSRVLSSCRREPDS